MPSQLPSTLGELRAAVSAGRVVRRPVRDEIRENLIARLRAKQPIFPGIIGFDETVVPHIVNAILSRHNFILLGYAGRPRAASPRVGGSARRGNPGRPGCEIHDDPLHRSVPHARARPGGRGQLPRLAATRRRYVEKLPRPT